MKKAGFLLVFIIVVNVVYSQSAEDSVKNTVNTLFTAMKTGDEKMLRESFTNSAVLQTIVKNKEGKVIIKTDGVADFATQIAKLSKGDADERISFDIVKVDADLAIVWTPYQFYYKGNFSHCGVNSFQLVRVNNIWKIQYLIDTKRKDNCK